MLTRIAIVVLSFCLGGTAYAGTATLRKAVQEKFPQARIESIVKTPYLGLYEIVVEGQILYSDEKFNYFFDGSVIEAKTLNNLTEERKRKLAGIRFEDLPLDLAFKRVKGDGRRRLAIFSDPDCPYCKRIEQELTGVTNVTIYTFLYPLEGLHPSAAEKARAVWCSADRGKAWLDLMLNDVVPAAAGDCDTPIERITSFGQKNRISGTPTLFFANGERVPGALPAAQLEKLLDAAGQ